VKSVRLPADVSAAVSEYAEEHGLSESDAMRRLIERGLAGDRPEEMIERLERIEEEVNRPLWQRMW